MVNYSNVFPKAFNKKLALKKMRKDARGKLEGINEKYTEAFAPDAVRDVERASRTESRRSQRDVKTGRSSTILSMRDEMGMDAIGIPSRMNVSKMEGASVERKLKSQQKGEIGAVRKNLLSGAEEIGEKVGLKYLVNLDLATSEEKKTYDANQKKKADKIALWNSRYGGRVSRIGGF